VTSGSLTGTCDSDCAHYAELDALGDDFEEEEGIPSYLREDATTELPDFVDEPPVTEQVSNSAAGRP
jgi:charged multivesicular body protein 5